MDKLEWINRCAKRFSEATGTKSDEFIKMAEVAFDEDGDNDFIDDPEGAANSEMSYWDNDEPTGLTY
jgi:hypothetical protein